MVIKVTDKGATDLLDRLAKKGSTKVGIVGKSVRERNEGTPLGLIASVHEFGLGNSPRRSFIRDYVDQNYPGLKRMISNVGKQVIDGMGMKEALDVFGLVVVGEMQDRISDHIPPPNTDATKDRKGSDTPLIDTGQLRSSISHATKVQ